ncbi:hypothetical protein T08_9609 [Trichinella sp. T8]|nr:hypothetical protein T08_9609 [Trichinella sp. T8]
MKFEAKCISAETQYLYANRCTTVYELERKYCYEIFKKEKLISLMTPSIHQRPAASHLDLLQIFGITLIDVMDAVSKKDHVDSPFY